ncbi:MAG: transposase [Deltaproteobacteria bacterium]|nr:transposase [Candidatus Zymogenaceae bacterium]
MARIARLIVPDIPHHITQRGNRRQRVFYSDTDKKLYLRLLLDNSAEVGLRWLAYCLMDNHVHLVGIPKDKDDFAGTLGETHRKYSTIINIREKWKGHLWQGRYGSCPLEDIHLYAAVRYVERNPVRARLVENAEEYPWSSTRSHLSLCNDPLLAGTKGYLDFGDWRKYLAEKDEEIFIKNLRLHERTGRPLGSEEFLAKLEALTGRVLRKQKTGRRAKQPKGSPPPAGGN